MGRLDRVCGQVDLGAEPRRSAGEAVSVRIRIRLGVDEVIRMAIPLEGLFRCQSAQFISAPLRRPGNHWRLVSPAVTGTFHSDERCG